MTKHKTVHTLYSPFDYALSDSILDRLFFSQITRSSFASLDGLVAVSENVRRSLILRHVDKNKINVIPPVISEDFFNSQLDSKGMRIYLEIDEKAPVVTYIGGFEDSKGLTVFMRIIPEVVSRIPEVVFVIALNTPNNDSRIRNLETNVRKLGLSKNVRLMGITDRITDVLRMSDAFAAPYLHTMGVADYPLAVFEAMAMGKIVIAFDVGGISTMLREDRGIAIRPGDIVAFVDAVVGTINNRAEMNNMSKAASEYVAENFSVKTTAIKTINLFEHILGWV